MYAYRAPLKDIFFLLEDVFDVASQLQKYSAWQDLENGDIELIVTEVARFCAEVVHPKNFQMGEEGCSLKNGSVATPSGMPEMFRKFAGDGWLGICGDAEHGGQEQPNLLQFAVMEALASSSLAFSDYVGTFIATQKIVRLYAPEELRQRYLKALLAGDAGGTQCMTEPQSGTDLSLLSTKAVPSGDGSYQITGNKIFISGGDQDLTEDIVHIVLARVPEDGPGNRGLSLFLVPKFLGEDGGGSRVRNAVACTYLEHKMGYGAQATCQLSFEAAKGWLMGERGKGLAAMFTMVNEARLFVGCQGFAAAEAASQQAAAYALERKQGRMPGARLAPKEPADPIIGHADVRRLLMQNRALTEAARALYYWLGLQTDIAHSDADPDRRKVAQAVLSMLTGVFKAMASDFGYQSTNDAMQIFGGHGYVRETGVEHYVRDCRVTQIFEGANGVLGYDLLRRVILRDEEQGFVLFQNIVREEVEHCRAIPALRDFATMTDEAMAGVLAASEWIRVRTAGEQVEASAAGADFLRLIGLTAYAWAWLWMMRVANRKLTEEPEADSRSFFEDKLFTGQFFFKRLLPLRQFHEVALRAGASTLTPVSLRYFQ